MFPVPAAERTVLTALPAWRLDTDRFCGGNPGAKVFPKLVRETRGVWLVSGGEVKERRVVESRRTGRTADPSRSQPPVSRLRGARVSVSVPRGGGPPVR